MFWKLDEMEASNIKPEKIRGALCSVRSHPILELVTPVLNQLPMALLEVEAKFVGDAVIGRDATSSR